MKKYIYSLKVQALLLSLMFILLPVLGLPPFRIGYFIQSEGVYTGLWGILGLFLLWYGRLFKKHPLLAKSLKNNPLTIGFAALGGGGLLSCVFIPHNALVSFFGANSTAEGIFNFFAMSFAVIPLRLTFLSKSYKRLFLGAALIVSSLVILLTLMGVDVFSIFQNYRFWQWATFYYPDFLAFNILGIVFIYFFIRKDYSHKSIYLIDALFAFSIGISSYYCYNKVLRYAPLLAFLTCGCVYFFPVKNKKIVTYLGGSALIASITLFIINYDYLSKHILPLAYADSLTLLSRTYLAKASFIDLFYKPIDFSLLREFIFGHGYGNFSKATVENLGFFSEFHIYKNAQLDPSWEYVHRDLLCSHNIFLDMFYGGGLLGFLTIIYTFYRCLKNIRLDYFYTGIFFYCVYLILLVFWFEPVNVMPFTLAAQVFFFEKLKLSKSGYLLSPVLSKTLAGLVLCLVSFHLYFLMFIQEHWLKKMTYQNISPNYTNSFFRKYDAYTSTFRQAVIVRSYLKGLLTYADDPKSTERKELLALYLELTKNLMEISPITNPNALAVAFNALSTLMSRPYVKEHLDYPALVTLWDKASKEMETYLPYRPDLQIPYLTYLQTTSFDQARFLNLLTTYQKTMPNSCVVSWFKGLNALKDPSSQKMAICLMKKAIDTGIEGFIPFEKPLIEKIKSQSLLLNCE